MTFVIDNSVTMAWCFADELSPYTDALRQRLLHEGVLVPAIWPLEVANALLTGERRQRLTPP